MNRSLGVVFTPEKVIQQMLDDLPPHVWTDHKLKWLDPCCGMGQFPLAIYRRLMSGLISSIPSEKKRRRHILTKMLYMAELNPVFAKKCKLALDPKDEFDLIMFVGDSLKMEFPSSFDVIVANPPYNLGAAPLYHKFVEHFIDKSQCVMMIIPSRWFSGGKGLDKFRSEMLARKDLVLLRHQVNSKRVFPDVNISGGVCYFLKDSLHNGLCKFNGGLVQLNKYDVLVEKKYHALIDRMKDEPKLSDLYMGRCYGVETNDARLLDKPVTGAIKCFVSQKRGFVQYIKGVEANGQWKIITTRGSNGDHFGNTFIGRPEEIHSGSYLSFRVNSKQEAESLLSYMKCKFAELMMCLRKGSQNISKSTVSFVPLPPLDRIWTDESIEKYYKLKIGLKGQRVE